MTVLQIYPAHNVPQGYVALGFFDDTIQAYLSNTHTASQLQTKFAVGRVRLLNSTFSKHRLLDQHCIGWLDKQAYQSFAGVFAQEVDSVAIFQHQLMQDCFKSDAYVLCAPLQFKPSSRIVSRLWFSLIWFNLLTSKCHAGRSYDYLCYAVEKAQAVYLSPSVLVQSGEGVSLLGLHLQNKRPLTVVNMRDTNIGAEDWEGIDSRTVSTWLMKYGPVSWIAKLQQLVVMLGHPKQHVKLHHWSRHNPFAWCASTHFTDNQYFHQLLGILMQPEIMLRDRGKVVEVALPLFLPGNSRLVLRILDHDQHNLLCIEQVFSKSDKRLVGISYHYAEPFSGQSNSLTVTLCWFDLFGISCSLPQSSKISTNS